MHFQKHIPLILIKCLFLALTLGGVSSASASQNTYADSANQSLDELYQLVQKHLKQKADQKLFDIKINIQEFSNRLKLPKCETPVEIQDRRPEKYSGRMTLKLFCPQPEWKLYVTANIEGKLPIVVSARGILKEAVITKGDVKQILVPYQKHKRGALININEAIGMRAKKSIGANTILTVRLLQRPYWIFKDNSVTIVTYVGNLKVESFGIALGDGIKGQQVPIRNSSSNKIVKGIVIAPNTVQIP